MQKKHKLVLGMGINDAGYAVVPRDGNKRLKCPYYERWQGILARAYSPTILKWNKTYEGVSVCDEWLTFSNFRAWMIEQDWEGKQLDKDLLVKGNKVYSPETCVFISERLNTFIQDAYDSEKGFSVGVSLFRNGKYRARIRDGGEGEHLGYYTTYEEARAVYDKRKLEIARELIEQESNLLVKEVLESIYFNSKLEVQIN